MEGPGGFTLTGVELPVRSCSCCCMCTCLMIAPLALAFRAARSRACVFLVVANQGLSKTLLLRELVSKAGTNVALQRVLSNYC